MIVATILLALRSLRRNTLRSFLTTIGIVIGVASVIAMVTLARGASTQITGEITALGTNLLIVVPGANRRGAAAGSRPFTLADAHAIQDQIADVAAVAPSAGSAARLVYGARNWSTSVTGANNAWFEVRNWDVAMGRQFREGEVRSGTSVCVLGEAVRRELFGSGDPVGARIRVASISCEVIGVLESRGQTTFGEDQDDFIVMPLLAVQRRLLGSDTIAVIAVSAREGASTERVQSEIVALFRQRRHVQAGEEDDFSVRDLREISELVGVVGGALAALLGAIAAVSLLVGGIGIMNIMLVSVTERTREIGIRLAIGARSGEILWQFLIEAVVLSLVGGTIGIALGLGGSAVAAHFLGLPLVLAIDVVAGAFVFAGLVGVFFGWYPARRASRLDPIEALRHE